MICYPFFAGERSPDLPHARASFHGLNAANTTRENLLHATVESATYGLRRGLDNLRRLGMSASHIVLTGGGARSAAWRQMVADVCELPVRILSVDEGASLGAALQALWIGLRAGDPTIALKDVTKRHLLVDRTLSVQPHPERPYAEHYAYWAQVLDDLAPVHEKRTN